MPTAPRGIRGYGNRRAWGGSRRSEGRGIREAQGGGGGPRRGTSGARGDPGHRGRHSGPGARAHEGGSNRVEGDDRSAVGGRLRRIEPLIPVRRGRGRALSGGTPHRGTELPALGRQKQADREVRGQVPGGGRRARPARNRHDPTRHRAGGSGSGGGQACARGGAGGSGSAGRGGDAAGRGASDEAVEGRPAVARDRGRGTRPGGRGRGRGSAGVGRRRLCLPLPDASHSARPRLWGLRPRQDRAQGARGGEGGRQPAADPRLRQAK
mmetsp:Transcript_6636/g.22863  ORF Transcript_6636/g.22863 Transcript_6636/m.22863 type:complete len:267 (+) Transcript_6636:296-1096(+)